MDLEIFVEHADRFAALQRRINRKALLQALAGEDTLTPSDADELADFIEEISADLTDEYDVLRLAEDIRRTARGSYPT